MCWEVQPYVTVTIITRISNPTVSHSHPQQPLLEVEVLSLLGGQKLFWSHHFTNKSLYILNSWPSLKNGSPVRGLQTALIHLLHSNQLAWFAWLIVSFLMHTSLTAWSFLHFWFNIWNYGFKNLFYKIPCSTWEYFISKILSTTKAAKQCPRDSHIFSPLTFQMI